VKPIESKNTICINIQEIVAFSRRDNNTTIYLSHGIGGGLTSHFITVEESVDEVARLIKLATE
jgi:hypothetical protein